MKAPPLGRVVFGASAVLFGIIALMWRDVETWQTLSRIWKLPGGLAIGRILMAAQILGGLGVLLPRTARPAALLLAIVYALFSLACIPDIVAAPGAYEHYGSFFEQFTLIWGATAIYASAQASVDLAAALARAARLGIGMCAVSYTLSQIVYLRFTASLVPTWIPPGQMFWAILTTIAFASAAIAILIDRQAQLALRLMTLMMASFGILVWIPLLIAHSEAHLNWSEFALTWLMTGAAWAVGDAAASSRSDSARESRNKAAQQQVLD
ncbi:MAG TPA: hypothetical protein VH331_01600 [Allosphingosinicella sp.]|jgi:hypothetical protein|nr:hypothetical protein [Allosphingosinicella sp.]